MATHQCDGALLLIAAILPIVSINAWDNRRARSVLLGVCWIVTVGCVSHALIGMVQRVASLAGALMISYPFWEIIDRTRADLQALFFNEPWFLIEGLSWAAIAWAGAMHESQWRWWWAGTVLFGVVVSVTIGLLSAFGVIGKWVVG